MAFAVDLTDDEIISMVIRWVNGMTDLPVARAYQGNDEDDPLQEEEQYITVDLITADDATENRISRSFAGEETESPSAGAIVEREYVFFLKCFRGDCTTILRRIKSAIKNRIELQEMDHGFIAFDAGAVTRLNEKFNNDWQPFAQMNLLVRGMVSDSNSVDLIEEIEPTIVDRL